MKSFLSTEHLAGMSARHPWRVVLIWLVVLAGFGALTATNLGDSLTSDIVISGDAESIEGFARLQDSGIEDVAPLTETAIIWSTDGRTVDDPEFSERIQAVTDEVRAMQARWAEEDGLEPNIGTALITGVGDYPPVFSYPEIAALGLPQAEELVSEDRQSSLVVIGLPSDGESAVRMHELYTTVDAFSGDGLEVATIGQLTFQERFSEIAEEDLIKGESIGVPMALLVLVAVFGALVAPLLPLVLGVASIAAALGMVSIAGFFGDQQLFIQNMITMLGLAVGIDYALFVVERFREERRHGHPIQVSIERAGATSSKAVVFSGATVVLSLAGVTLIPTNIFRSLGVGAILVVVASVAASLTLLPAMLSLLGDRINWPRKAHAREKPKSIAELEEEAHEGFWGRTTTLVMAKPVISVLLAAGVLLAAAIPAMDMRTGVDSIGALPPGHARDGYARLIENFPAGVTGPVQFVLGGERADIEPVLEALNAELAASGLFVGESTEPAWSEDGRTVEFSTTLMVDPTSDEAFDIVRIVRGDIIPGVLGDNHAVPVWVTGTTATNLDFIDVVSDYTPWVFAFVLTLSFILLMLAFRSIVVPLKAIILNLLSVGATWGILVLVFQKGYLADFFGFQRTPTIQVWVPILAFAVLFGLSMDYHVFLLSRIREHFDLTQRNRASVAVGLHATARIITGAALIMVVVFGGFASGSLVALQQLGFGLAVAVFLDATIVRSVLVPASMALLGNVNWYLPNWLHWLPDLRVEGHVPEVVPASGQGQADVMVSSDSE
jgi:RND superfamily putative drug exporter